MFAKIENGQFVRWVDLGQEYPYTCFPTPLTTDALPEGVVQVTVGAVPEVQQFEIAERAPQPLLVDGVWVLPYVVRGMSDDERAHAARTAETRIRQQRAHLLLQSDWTQVLDAPVDRAAWAAYRQALRDVPQQLGFPWAVVWPSTPT